MAKKRRVRRRVSRSRRASARNSGSSGKKTRVALWNLIIFALISVISYFLYKLTIANSTLSDFFSIASLITAMISLAFLVAFLLLKFMKGIKR